MENLAIQKHDDICLENSFKVKFVLPHIIF